MSVAHTIMANIDDNANKKNTITSTTNNTTSTSPKRQVNIRELAD